ncbi:MAG: ATP-binding protein [Planctomycetes bacterium]|nr:ATP-binding protein [Planctomycetota bacterium]
MPISESELIRYIEAVGEENNFDAKGPMKWDGAEASAGLAKDIAALANSRDGGVLVIGISEDDGTLQYDGLTPEQAESFDTTKMSNWINSRFSPAIKFTSYRVTYNERVYVVITVSEFDEIPTVCEKPFDRHLNRGIYVRSDTASTPITSADQLRELIGLATVKRGNQLLEMFQAALKGSPILPAKPEIDQYEAERKEVFDDLKANGGAQLEEGAWTFLIQPVVHKERWNDSQELKAVVEKCTVRLGREFPHIGYEPQNMMWGFLSQHYQDVFGFTKTGLFEAIRLFRENGMDYKSPWVGSPGIPKGKWLEWRLSISYFVDFFLFASRLVEHFDAGEEFELEITCSPIRGRRLAALQATSGDPSEPVAAAGYKFKKRFSGEELRSAWKNLAVEEAHRFVSLFFSDRIAKKTIQDWVESILNRT